MGLSILLTSQKSRSIKKDDARFLELFSKEQISLLTEKCDNNIITVSEPTVHFIGYHRQMYREYKYSLITSSRKSYFLRFLTVKSTSFIIIYFQ